MDISFEDFPIEDLGDFLNEQFGDPDSSNWRGFSLGYSKDNNWIPGDETRKEMESLTTVSPFSSPGIPGSENQSLSGHNRMKAAIEELGSFKIEDSELNTWIKKVNASSEQSPSENWDQRSSKKTMATQQVPRKVPISATTKRPFTCVEGSSVCGTITPSTENEDRGQRKKSREKMRRLEVNVKMDELLQILGLTSKVRKSAVLQEAVNTIKVLRRECDELRLEKQRMHGEMAKLANCLQFPQVGSTASVMTPPPAPAPVMNGGCVPINPPNDSHTKGMNKIMPGVVPFGFLPPVQQQQFCSFGQWLPVVPKPTLSSGTTQHALIAPIQEKKAEGVVVGSSDSEPCMAS